MPRHWSSCWAQQVRRVDSLVLCERLHCSDWKSWVAGNLFTAMDVADRDKLIEYVFPDGRLPVMTQVCRVTLFVCNMQSSSNLLYVAALPCSSQCLHTQQCYLTALNDMLCRFS